MITSHKIRRRFLSYFKEKGHTIIASSPVVPYDDPTLLFTNAGMNQFKDVFLGKSIRDYTKAVSSQKCIRVGGKHNDLENVGHTSRHLTFFEMLGNFSFGDYFKKEAIAFSWEVTLKVFEFDPEKIWVSVFHEDEESFELWTHFLPESRIIRMGEEDNFWAMGDVGPCGPCSELYFDKGPQYGVARNPAEDIEGNRYLEFWNLVFMQFDRGYDSSLTPLPKPCVDTGCGLERIVSLKMGVDTLFETDILAKLIYQIEKVSGKSYKQETQEAAAFRVIADHVRTLSFAIADGVQPSNIERGYVLRKVLRRAVRYGRQLDLDRPFLSEIAEHLIQLMHEDFPEIKASKERIFEILNIEEENFLKTLRRGGNIMNQIIENAKKTEGRISGEEAFKLKDTYGFPLEEILLLAKDAHLAVDIQQFEELQQEAREKSKKARKAELQQIEDSLFQDLLRKIGPTEFVGYKQTTSEAVVLALLKEGKEVPVLFSGEEGMVLLDKTPFYAEKGGQVGDTGILVSSSSRFTVADCQMPFTDVIVHHGVVAQGTLKVSNRVTAQVDDKRRIKIERNHTATHLLHWALTQLLGPHIKQAGSVVEPGRLRFDFNHHKALSQEEISEIERLINEKIRQNHSVISYELPLSEVMEKKEIKQFFGEKYGSFVRVVDIDYSKELCGGTHTAHVGNIGYFRILKESSIASGVRRIEAATGEEAEDFVSNREEVLLSLAEKLKAQPFQLMDKIENLLQENKRLEQEKDLFRRDLMKAEIEKLLEQIKKEGSCSYLSVSVERGSKELKEFADLIMQKQPSLLLFLIGKQKESLNVIIRVSPDLVSKGIHAQELMKEIAVIIQGKGGGRSDSAQGGGARLDKIPEALSHTALWIKKKNI